MPRAQSFRILHSKFWAAKHFCLSGSFFFSKNLFLFTIVEGFSNVERLKGERLQGIKWFKSDEYSTGGAEDSPLAAKQNRSNSVSGPIMKKVVLKHSERRFADPKVVWKVTFSKGYYLFREKTTQMECDQEVNQQTYGIASLFPHTRAFWVTGSLKHPWGRRRHRQLKLINLTQASDGGVTTMWLALSHPSSGMLPPWIKNVGFFSIVDVELLLPVLSVCEKIVRLLTTASHCNTQQHALYLCSDGDETTSED